MAASWVKPATFAYLASLEWIAARENACLVGSAGTGKSHLLVALVVDGRRLDLVGADAWPHRSLSR